MGILRSAFEASPLLRLCSGMWNEWNEWNEQRRKPAGTCKPWLSYCKLAILAWLMLIYDSNWLLSNLSIHHHSCGDIWNKKCWRLDENGLNYRWTELSMSWQQMTAAHQGFVTDDSQLLQPSHCRVLEELWSSQGTSAARALISNVILGATTDMSAVSACWPEA